MDGLKKYSFHSVFSGYFTQFIEEKRALGYKYRSGVENMLMFDRFLVNNGVIDLKITKPIIDQWIAKKPNEKEITQKRRIHLAHMLGSYLRKHQLDVYLPDPKLMLFKRNTFIPRIFTRDEVNSIIKAIDSMHVKYHSPNRQVVMSSIFRILYSCGLRCGECVRLKLSDVNLDIGILTIRESKFKKDRLVPFSKSLLERLRVYVSKYRFDASGSDYLFPSPRNYGNHYGNIAVYSAFRSALQICRISHGGRGKGPRLHDLRHTFAVHKLLEWYRAGEDLSCLFPVLSTYMGHTSIYSTQHYIHMVAEMYPDLTDNLEKEYNVLIPKGQL